MRSAFARAIPRGKQVPSSRSLSATSSGNGRQRLVLGAALLGVAGGTAWAVESDSAGALGTRRSVLFWSKAFPMFVRYRILEEYVRFVRKFGSGMSDEEELAQYNILHDRFSGPAVALCISLGGYFFKSAQLMSTRDEFIPAQYMVHLKKLQDDAPPQRSGEEVRELVAAALGRPIEEVFSDFVDEAIGAASIGQVHRARLASNGDEVAVKVMYPGAESLFRSDMSIIKNFCALAQPQHVPALREVERQFLSEFDYVMEAANMQVIGSAINAHPKWSRRCKVPKAYPDLCSQEVLVMEFLPGVKMIDGLRNALRKEAVRRGVSLGEMEAEERARIARDGLSAAGAASLRMSLIQALLHAKDLVLNIPRAAFNFTIGTIAGRVPYQWTEAPPNVAALLELLLQVHGFQLFSIGCFNGDPHPGNILLMPDGRLGLIDYGSSVRVSVEDRRGLAKFIIAIAKDDAAEVVRNYIELGIRTKHMNPEILYKAAAFWYDRDTPDVTGEMNVHHFTEWMHEQDPVENLPDTVIMPGRVSVMLRGMGAAMGIKLRTAPCWAAEAEHFLRRHP